MKLSIIIPVHNQHALATAALDVMVDNLSREQEVELLVLDNGSTTPFFYVPAAMHEDIHRPSSFKLVRIAKNIGVYPTFWEGLKHTSGDIVAYFHSDVFVAEKDWDKRVVEAFEQHERLGLLGFIGSNEIDAAGGRGLGTSSNFQGNAYASSGPYAAVRTGWQGSAAEVHGRREEGYMNAAVVDGCVMIFRRSVLESISQREDFPPHHFYDKLLSSEVLEKGFEVGVLGVGFDHISGQTVNQEEGYKTMAQEWAEAHDLAMSEGGWDITIYIESERQWLTEYRDIKHLIPIRV